MGKNVAVFVDVANIFYAAKAAGVDIDYVTLLRSASAGRDLVRAYAYTGLDPDNENQRNFHSFLARNGYRVVSKDIRKYGDGKVKANLDIELVVDMMKTARNLDIAIVVSGDGDFAPAIRAVQEMGVRCEVISFRGNTSSDLIEVADQFTDITQLAKVEKGSRSGRRVATDEEDLSMTEVPDKQTEGSGRTRSRGRGREREREPVAATSGSTRTRRRGAASAGGENGSTPIVAIPGERLSKAVVGGLTEADLAAAEVFTLDEEDQEIIRGPAAVDEDAVSAQAEGEGEDGPRRRRRRGGRGRGRGRGRAEAGADVQPRSEPSPRSQPVEELDDEELSVAPRPSPTPFGSVWDSQLGTITPAPGTLAPLSDDEFDDEPEIPEYLIAERNRGRGGRGRSGARGGRSAYQSAIARERYGRGGGGGINRYPDVSERTSRRGGSGTAPRREERPPASQPAARSGGEWSEVPPEVEELLRAQLGQTPGATATDARTSTAAAGVSADLTAEASVAEASIPAEPPAAPAPRRRSTRTKAADDAPAGAAAATPRRRTSRAKVSAAPSSAEGGGSDAEAGNDAGAAPDTAAAAPSKRTRKAKPASTAATTLGDAEAPKPRRRSTKTADEGGETAAATTTKRRTTRKKAETEPA